MISLTAPNHNSWINNIEYEGPLARHAWQVDAAKVLEHPAGCGVLYRLFVLAWEGGLRVCKSLPDTIAI